MAPARDSRDNRTVMGDPGLEPGTSSLSEDGRSWRLSVRSCSMPHLRHIRLSLRVVCGSFRDGCGVHDAFKLLRHPVTSQRSAASVCDVSDADGAGHVRVSVIGGRTSVALQPRAVDREDFVFERAPCLASGAFGSSRSDPEHIVVGVGRVAEGPCDIMFRFVQEVLRHT